MEAAQLSRPLAIAARLRKTSWVIFADGELTSRERPLRRHVTTPRASLVSPDHYDRSFEAVDLLRIVAEYRTALAFTHGNLDGA